jgi:hypothetical protein
MQGGNEAGFDPTTRPVYYGTFELYAKMKALSSSASKLKNAEFHPEIETQSAAARRADNQEEKERSRRKCR